MSVQQLLIALQDRERLNAKIFALTQSVKHDMIEKGLDKIETKAGKLKLKSLAKKANKRAIVPTAEMADLQSALEAEKQELLDMNKSELYRLQKQKDIAEHSMDLLLQNEWINELKEKLALAEQKAKKAKLSEPEGYIQLDVELVEQDYIALAGDAWIAEAISKAKSLQPRKMTRSMVLKFIAQYYKGYFEGMTLDEAWAKRIEDHITYWKGRI